VRSPLARGAIALAAIALVVVLFVVLAGGDDDNKSSTTTRAQSSQGTTQGQSQRPAAEQVLVRDGKPVGGVKRLEYGKGDQVRFVVRSDVADEIHVHGYDFKKDVPAGGSVRFSFPAKIDGVFEIELEGRKEQIAELRVNP
jgi:hypothetical protein